MRATARVCACVRASVCVNVRVCVRAYVWRNIFITGCVWLAIFTTLSDSRRDVGDLRIRFCHMPTSASSLPSICPIFLPDVHLGLHRRKELARPRSKRSPNGKEQLQAMYRIILSRHVLEVSLDRNSRKKKPSSLTPEEQNHSTGQMWLGNHSKGVVAQHRRRRSDSRVTCVIDHGQGKSLHLGFRSASSSYSQELTLAGKEFSIWSDVFCAFDFAQTHT